MKKIRHQPHKIIAVNVFLCTIIFYVLLICFAAIARSCDTRRFFGRLSAYADTPAVLRMFGKSHDVRMRGFGG